MLLGKMECLVCGSYEIVLERHSWAGGFAPTCQECGEQQHLRLAGERRRDMGTVYRVRLLKRYRDGERWETFVANTGKPHFGILDTAEKRALALAGADRDIMSVVVKAVTVDTEWTVRWYDRAGDRMARVPEREEERTKGHAFRDTGRVPEVREDARAGAVE